MIAIKSLANPSTDQKRLGAFYTPENLSKVLTDWAIQSSTDRILEPSFGGCGFLETAKKRLNELGCKKVSDQIYGCDIDPNAFRFLNKVFKAPQDTDKFRNDDFLDLQPYAQWAHNFEVVTGNPPYIPYQAIPAKRRRELAKRAEELGCSVGGRASLWAHFLIHSVGFVNPGGRMAWVLPGSFLQADYADGVRKFLARSFDKVLCVLMHQRFFKEEGTEEETVVLLTSKRRASPTGKEIAFAEAASLSELVGTITVWEQRNWRGKCLDARPSYLAVPDDAIAAFEKVLHRDDCKSIGDFLTINIGLVTGANSFFVLTSDDRKRLALRRGNTCYVVPKFRSLKGLSFSLDDHKANLQDGERGHLVNVKKMPKRGTPLRKYLDSFSEELRDKIGTFKKRAIWHAPQDKNIPHAFMSVMNHDGPRIVLNDARINCTNSIHRVFFKGTPPGVKKKLLAISLLTSYSQLSAEFVGRRYGSGVLKHEPREAERISVLMPDNISVAEVNRTFKEIDRLLREGNSKEAHSCADKLIFYPIRGGRELAARFSGALQAVRELRRSTRYISGA